MEPGHHHNIFDPLGKPEDIHHIDSVICAAPTPSSTTKMLVIRATLPLSLTKPHKKTPNPNPNKKRVLTSSVSLSKDSSTRFPAQTPDSQLQALSNCSKDIAEPSSPKRQRRHHVPCSYAEKEVHRRLYEESRESVRRWVLRVLR